jgi:hypothetical protein
LFALGIGSDPITDWIVFSGELEALPGQWLVVFTQLSEGQWFVFV